MTSNPSRAFFARPAVVLACLLVAAFGAFFPALFNSFLFDDLSAVVENHWLTFGQIPRFFRNFFLDSSLTFVGFRPLLMSSFAVERELFGPSPWIYRCTNIVLHALITFLVYQLAIGLARSDVRRSERKFALFVALFFLLHPVQTNVITLAWKRSDLWVTLGILLSFIGFQRWSERRGGFHSLALGYLGAWVAILSKESALILLPALFLGDQLVWKRKRTPRERDAAIYCPIFLFTVVHIWILFVAMPRALQAFPYQPQTYTPPSMQLDRWAYFQTQAAALLEYLKLILWPAGLNVFHYLPPVRQGNDPRLWAGILVTAASLGVGWMVRKKNPVVTFAICWFFLGLLPSSSLVPLDLSVDEDRLYLPMIGIAILVALALFRSLDLASKQNWKLAKPAIAIAPVVLFAVYAGHDLLRTRSWRDAVTLWSMNVRDEAQDVRAWVNLGQAYADAGQAEKADAAFRHASDLDPEYAVSQLFYGAFLVKEKRYAEAKNALLQVVRRDSFQSRALLNLGILASDIGNSGEAGRFFTLSLITDPRNVVTLRNFSTLLEREGEIDAAFRSLRQAILISPLDPDTQLRTAYLIWNYRKDALGTYILLREVLRTRPNDPMALALRAQIQDHLKVDPRDL